MWLEPPKLHQIALEYLPSFQSSGKGKWVLHSKSNTSMKEKQKLASLDITTMPNPLCSPVSATQVTRDQGNRKNQENNSWFFFFFLLWHQTWLNKSFHQRPRKKILKSEQVQMLYLGITVILSLGLEVLNYWRSHITSSLYCVGDLLTVWFKPRVHVCVCVGLVYRQHSTRVT